MRARMVEESLSVFESLSTIESIYAVDMFGKLLDIMEISNTRACVDNFYVNVDLFNKTGGYNNPTAASAEQTINYAVPLLDKPENYSVSIEKAIFPLNLVPLFRRSKRYMVMNVECKGTTYQYNYSFTGEEEVYDVSEVLNKMNADIEAACVGAGSTIAKSPFFYFNPSSQLFEYHTPVLDAADLLAHQYVVQDDERDPGRLQCLAARVHPCQLPHDLHRPDLV